MGAKLQKAWPRLSCQPCLGQCARVLPADSADLYSVIWPQALCLVRGLCGDADIATFHREAWLEVIVRLAGVLYGVEDSKGSLVA